MPPFRGGTAAPHFLAHVCCLCLCRFLDRPFPHSDKNPLVWFKPTTLCGLSVCFIPVMGFSINLASNHCFILLQDSTKHLPSTGTTQAICTRTLNLHYYHTRFLCSISYIYGSLFSTFSSVFNYVDLGSSPYVSFLSIRSSSGQWADRADRTDNGPIALGEPFYKWSPKNRLPYAIGPLSVCVSVCLSVCLSCNTLVYCGQTVGGLMPLGTEVGLGPGHIVLDGTQVPHRKQPSSPQVFGRCLLWLNGRPSQQLLSCS